jgi:PAS domain S-box-containing protein
MRLVPSQKTVVTTLGRIWSLVPSGGSLPERVWRGRRQFLVGLVWFHAVAIMAAGPVLGHRWEWSIDALLHHGTVLHTAIEGLAVAFFAVLACWPRASRTFQATAVGFGLMSASGILVHLSGGYIEAHFHFFVMLAFLALFQDWIPYLLAVAFVAVHHGVVGVIWPTEVYNHAAAYASPWTWAAIHAAFVLASCVGSVIAWRFNERAFAQTALILEAAGEGIFGLDMDGRITFINPAAAGMLDVDAQKVIGTPVETALRQLEPEGAPIPLGEWPIFAPLTDGRARSATDEIFARRNGSYFSVDYVTTPMIERSRLTGLVVTFNDVTERHRSAAALQRSHRQLEEAIAELKATQRQILQQERLRAVGQMASGIAHDFNNTLSPIVGFSELLLRGPDTADDQRDRYLQLINTAAQDAAAVVRRLGDLYRERPDGDPQAAASIPRCIEQAVALTQPRWRTQAQAKGVMIDVTTEVADGLPLVAAEGSQMREMLTNLIFNAVDAMPEGGIITLRARPEGDQVALEVCDTGTGMTDEVRQRCLEPFFSTKGKQGTGLGLALVNNIIERHGGTMAIDSRLGHGTTIIARLPRHASTPPVAAPARPLEAPRRLRILLVEDEPAVRTVITHQLSSEGHTVDSASNGREGLDKFMSGWFDLVITDRAMPEMGGDQLAAAVIGIAPNKPIIMLTGFGDLMVAKDEHPVGIRAIVSKPVTLDALRQAIVQATDPAPQGL